MADDEGPEIPDRLPVEELKVSNASPTTVVLTVGEVIDRIGYGPFQRRMLIAAGLCSASDAMEVLILSFLSLSVQQEWELTPNETSSLISSVFAGAFVGTLILGRLGDVWGRRPAFLATAAIVAGFGLLSAACTSYWQLLLTRAMVGVGIGGVTVPFDIYGECLPSYCRGKGLVYPSYFWTTGTMLVVAGARLTLQENGSGWRYLCLLCAVPCIVATCVGFLVVPESPQWLLARHARTERYRTMGQPASFEHQAALLTLRNAAEQNGLDPDEVLPNDTILVSSNLDQTTTAAAPVSTMTDESANGCRHSRKSATVISGSSPGSNDVTSFHDTIPPAVSALPQDDRLPKPSFFLWDLLSPRRLKSSLAIWSIWFGYALLYYGTILAITAVFTTTISSTSIQATNSQSREASDDQQDDEADDFDISSITSPSGGLHFDFGAILFASLAEVIAATFLVVTIDKWGRRRLHSLSFGLGGVFVLALCWVAASDNDGRAPPWLSMILAFGGRFWIFSGSTVTWIWTAEVLETKHRTTGHGLANAGGRIGGFLSPYLVSPSQVSYTTMGFVLWAVSWFLVGIAWSSLPETLGTTMGEAIGAAPTHKNRTIGGGVDGSSVSLELGSPATLQQKKKKKNGEYRQLSSSSSLV